VPWRGPAHPGEFPTLGYDIADWIEARCAIPDGEHAGAPYLLTDEMVRFLLWFYRLEDDGRFAYARGGQLVEPQKWGKGPFSAAITCAEAQGPVIFDGWDASGEPVGRPWATPWIQVTAVSEDQTDNIWRALQPMIELGDIKADIPDTGLTRINLPGGGRIEPVTASARSRLGQRITFAPEDETHSWLPANGGRRLADTQRRNLAGMGGRFLETTNAWDPAEDSVAQATAEDKEPGVYRQDPICPDGSIRNKADRRRMLRAVYGDSAKGDAERGIQPWVDLDRIELECLALLDRDPAQAERFFLNRKRAAEDAVFRRGAVEARRVEQGEAEAGELIVIGVDGARFRDALGIVATDVVTGHQWPLGIWEAPRNPPDDYEHPFDEIDGTMQDAFDRWQVWRTYVDPQWIDHLLDLWQGRWGEKRVTPWVTNRPRPAAHAVRGYVTAMNAGPLTHNGDAQFVAHLLNAKRQKVKVFDDQHRQMYVMAKEFPDSPRKIDGAWAGCLSWEARGDAIAAGARKRARAIRFG
jgi:hypothetical protein